MEIKVIIVATEITKMERIAILNGVIDKINELVPYSDSRPSHKIEVRITGTYYAPKPIEFGPYSAVREYHKPERPINLEGDNDAGSE